MPAYRSSKCDLKTCTFLFAMIARRTRRMSSSLLPLNITPQTTSIQPARPLEKEPSEITAAVGGAVRAARDRRHGGRGGAVADGRLVSGIRLAARAIDRRR